MRYIDSMRETGHSRVNLPNLKGNHAYGVGLRFDAPIDLRNQTFNINFNSADDSINTDPLSIHLYFHSQLAL